jgi:LysR family nitrogen assimilation transcriptional regulator
VGNHRPFFLQRRPRSAVVPRLINTLRLERFLILARVGHLGRAAAEIGIGQAGFSKEMKIFQTELGIELFNTHPHGVSLTAKGLSLVNLGEGLMRLFRTLQEPDKEVDTEDSSHLGVTTRLSESIVPAIFQLLDGFENGRKIVIRDLGDAALEASVLDGSLDAALIFDPPPRVACDSVLIRTEELVFVHPPVWALELPARPLKAREFAPYPLINVRSDVSTRVLVDRFCQKQGMRPIYGIEVEQPATMVAMMLKGLGAAVCHASTVEDELRRGSLLAHRIGSPPIVATLKLYFRRDMENSHHVVRLLAIVRKLMSSDDYS